MFEKNKLSEAVKIAISAMTLGVASSSLPVWAEDDESTEPMEEVVVTGSRIKRAVDDSASPVTIIDAVDLQISGHNSVADVLRNTTYNSFGSFRERSGTSFGQIALVDLRGLGPDRTAVLINGRRVPGNPFTGASSVDLNSIPLTAVRRIEILTDSASAVYGADAIGGVINFIMRDDYDGAEVQIGMTRPKAKGADEEQVKTAFGIILEDENVKGILVNIFGGIMRCDIIARGIIEATKALDLNIPLVVRLAGTNVDQGKEILAQSGLNIHAANDLAEGAEKIVSLIGGGV